MLRITVLSLFIFPWFFLAAMSFPGVSSAQDLSCAKCHPDIGKGQKYRHPAINLGCSSCHLPKVGRQHPKEKESMQLTYDIPTLCFHCHKEKKFTGKYIHLPTERAMCMMCHDPHQSDIEDLLRSEPQELCYRCHAREKFTKPYIHKVALGGCGIRCHNHHASDYPHLLSSEIGDLCIGCHKIQESGTHIVSLPGGKVHPVFWKKDPGKRKRAMTCSSCHNPHGSKYRKLFIYKPICKRCHKIY